VFIHLHIQNHDTNVSFNALCFYCCHVLCLFFIGNSNQGVFNHLCIETLVSFKAIILFYFTNFNFIAHRQLHLKCLLLIYTLRPMLRMGLSMLNFYIFSSKSQLNLCKVSLCIETHAMHGSFNAIFFFQVSTLSHIVNSI